MAKENPYGESGPHNLENLEHQLYSRTPPPLKKESWSSEERHIRIAPGWTEEAERKESALLGVIGKIMPWIKRIFIASILFALFAGSVALYGFWRGANTVSSQNITISVLGPVAAPAGEELFLEVNVANYNDLELSAADLLIEYPDGTRKPSDISEPLLRYREALGAIAPQGTVSRRLSMMPFGEEGARKSIKVSLEYRPKDSNAIFSRKAEYEFAISAAPVTVTIENPREVNSGQTFETVVEIASNASSVIKKLSLKAEYPVGFQFQEGSPAPTFGKDTWLLGDLKPQAKRTVRIKGRIDAVEEEARTLRFSVGTESPKDEKLLGTVFLSEVAELTVKRPFVSLDLLLNGEKGKTFIARGTGPYRADVVWQNNLPTLISDVEITAKLEGSIFERSSVHGGGFYDSSISSVIWHKRVDPNFASIEPGDGGTLSFTFELLPVATNPSLYKNPSMQIHVFARGKRLDELGAYQEVMSSFTKEIRVASTLSLQSRVAYGGSGPVPPKAEQETVYTVTWALSNSSNGVSDARVAAILPSYVKWVGSLDANASVAYNPLGGEVVWEVGDVESGTGIGKAPREVSFQVSVAPSLSQVNTQPVLIGDAVATADDRFTGIKVESNRRPALHTGSTQDGILKGTVVR